MSKKTQKVDVLSVMDRAIVRNLERGAVNGSQSDRELRSARFAINELIILASLACPYLRDAGDAYEDDGSNEPLETARDLEVLLARIGGAE